MSAAQLDAEARLRIISDTTRAFLDTTTDLQRLLETVVSRTAEVIGDSCSLFMFSEDRSVLVPSALADRDPEALIMARGALMEPLRLDLHPVLAHVAATGETFVRHFLDLEQLRPPRSTPVYYEFVQRVRMHGLLIVALRVHGESIGVLTLMRHRGSTAAYGEQDVAVAQILADHAALAIASSRLYAAERSARSAARQADSALQETERSHKRFFDLSPLAQFIFDAESERILAVNSAALELYGYAREEFLAVQLAELRPPQLAAETRAAIAAAGNADRELESFSYSVAHDLRAPLRGLSGFSEILLDEYRDKLDADGLDALQEIRDNSRKMGILIDALLSLSHVTRSELKAGAVDLSALVRSIAGELQAAEPRMDFELVVASDLKAKLDPHLARTLVTNLVGNAWKFTSKTTGARIEFGAKDSDGHVTFFVRDNGAGFDVAHAAKLFVPFHRLHTVSEFPGTGIGLSTAQRIVSRFGGRIWADGQVNKGATFYFTLSDQPQEPRT